MSKIETNKKQIKFGIGFCADTECPFYSKAKCIHEKNKCRLNEKVDVHNNRQMIPNDCPLLNNFKVKFLILKVYISSGK